MPDLRGLAAELDAQTPERVLVYGSQPERASDLDLLVRPAARAALEAWLPTAGFRLLSAGWTRVSGGITAVVDLADVDEWDLDAQQVDDLFASAVPLPGLDRLVRPSPPHALLVLARRVQTTGGRLGHRQLARGRSTLLEDPDALEDARAKAVAWGCAGALEILAADLQALPLAPQRRRELLAADGSPPPVAWRRAAGSVARRAGDRGVVVSVSGLDGSGKSTLTAGVVDALDSLGYEPIVLWHRISYGRTLRVLAAPVKGALHVARALRGRGSAATQEAASGGTTATPAAGASTPAVAAGPAVVWPAVVTLVHVLTAGPVTRWHLRRGRVVVRDRYVLDALVQVLDRYGAAAPPRLHRLLLSLGLPTPLVAVLLDVPAEEAYRRKPEQFDLPQLTRQRELYLAHQEHLGVLRLDGTQPPPELRDRVVREVVAALSRRPAGGVRLSETAGGTRV